MSFSNQQILDKNTQWRQFCAMILSGKAADGDFLDISTQSSSDFIQFLHRHGLQTLLIELLEQQQKTNRLPGAIIERLVEIRRNTYIKEIYRKRHLGKLLDLFEQTDIQCLLLKGTALAYGIYQNPFQRPRIDTDLLVKSSDKEKIDRILIDSGFSKSPTISGELISHQNTYRQNQDNIDHAYDVHWKISNRNAYNNRFEFDQLFMDKVNIPGLSEQAYGLDHISAFLHSTVHYFGHKSDERDRLIWIYDMHLLCSEFSEQDWELLLQTSKDKQFDPLVQQMLVICKNTLASNIPRQVIDQLEKSEMKLSRIESRRLNAENWSRIDQFKSDWAILNFKQRCQLVKEYLLPPSEFILKQNNSTNKLLLPYFYIKRIVCGGFKLLFKQQTNQI